jgi:hypothetical protein
MMLAIWILVFHTPLLTFEGGQYVSRDRCEAAALTQRDHWKRTYRTEHIVWRCHRIAWEDQ